MPYEGGLLTQPSGVINRFQVIMNITDELEEIEMQRLKSGDESGSRST